MAIIKRWTLASVSLAAILAAPALAKPAAKTAAANKQAIQAAYHQMDRAFERRDANAIYKFYDSAFVGYSLQGGQEDLDTSRAETAAFFPHLLRATSSTIVESAKPQDNGVVVTDRTLLSAVVVDPYLHKRMSLNQIDLSRDFWVREAGGWKLRQSRDLAVHTTLDGRTIPESALEGSI